VDMFKTPDSAILALLLTLPHSKRPSPDRPIVIWDPFAGIGDNPIARVLRSVGYTVLESDIQKRDGFRAGVAQGVDFFGRMPPDAHGVRRPILPTDTTGKAICFDAIIANPPYSRTNEFLERLQELNVWWAGLLPLQTAESIKRQQFFKAMSVTVRIIPNRVNYGLSQDMEADNGRVKASNSMPFNTSWFSSMPEESRLWKSTSQCPVLPFTVASDIVKRCVLDTTKEFEVLEVARLHVAEYYPGMKLTDAGKLVQDRTPKAAARRPPARLEPARVPSGAASYAIGAASSGLGRGDS
jgi:hypothetical protein